MAAVLHHTLAELSRLDQRLASPFRDRIAAELVSRVAGAEAGQQASRIHDAPGPRWFAPDRPIRVVHADASMFVAGLRAVLLQSLHPLAMAGVSDHSGFRGDPWGRLQRTSYFLAVTTFGAADDAAAAVARVRAIHGHVNGTAEDGRPYSAMDSDLLRWVHVAEVDSFLAAHQRYGAHPLNPDEADGYVEDMAQIARALGVSRPPLTVAELREQLQDFRPALHATAAARDAARFVLFSPPLPLVARAPYAALSAAAVSLLPRWARWPLRLPYLPVTEATVIRLSGEAVTRGIRWALTPPKLARPETQPVGD